MNKVKGIINNIKDFFRKIFNFKKPAFLKTGLFSKIKIKGNGAGIALVVTALVLGVLYYFRGLFIAATVNGQPISRIKIIQSLEKSGGKSALDNAITEALVLQEAKKLNKTATAAQIDAEVDNIRKQLQASGQTLDSALKAEGATMEQFRKQIMLQKTLENILADKIQVTQAEVDKFIEDNKSAIPEGMAKEEVEKIAQQNVKSQKLSTEFKNWLDMVKTKSSINYLVKY